MSTHQAQEPVFTGKTVLDGRLAWFRDRHTDADAWADHWQALNFDRMLALARQGHLFDREAILLRHLPRRGCILEAGCGTGRYVLALRARGYDVIGLDYDLRTLRAARPHLPAGALHAGDGFALPYAAGSFSAVLSFGVVEHDRRGPEAMLCELARVLACGGVLILAVPYFNPLRRVKAALGLYPRPAAALPPERFYQYAFRRAEFRRVLESGGFRVIAWQGGGALLGLRRELPRWLSRLLARPRLSAALNRLGGRSRLVTAAVGHQMFFVAERL